MTPQGQRDTITDFTPGTDNIDLSAIDANPTRRGQPRQALMSSEPWIAMDTNAMLRPPRPSDAA